MANRLIGLPQVTVGCEICSLKIRVSVVRFRPWPPFQISKLGRSRPASIPSNSPQVPIWCPLQRGTNRFRFMLNVRSWVIAVVCHTNLGHFRADRSFQFTGDFEDDVSN